MRQRHSPRTAALDDQIKHSLSSLEKWWLTVLDRGFVWKSRHGLKYFAQWHEFAPTELLFDSYLQWAQETREKHTMTREQLGAFMTSVYPKKRPSGSYVIGEVPLLDGPGGNEVIEQSRPAGYELRALTPARNAFSKKLCLDFGWGMGDMDPVRVKKSSVKALSGDSVG